MDSMETVVIVSFVLGTLVAFFLDTLKMLVLQSYNKGGSFYSGPYSPFDLEEKLNTYEIGGRYGVEG
jgi:hypothetical protein